ncbi:bifunctional phosphoglucose/phosphomannose isomerase [bacterium]|nr:bifunctional phosphoglucose/phosphomannose isomerase [bacterium]
MLNNIDKSNLRQVILDGADQFAEGLELAKDIKLTGDFKSIMLSGMGGSALPGNILRIYLNDLFKKSSSCKRLAVYQNRFYSLPPEAYTDCLNFICSYSGNTEETISSFREVLKNNLPCVGISSGGEVERMCRENNISHIKLPSGIQPRMATGYFFAVIFQVLVNAGLVADKTEELINLSKNLKKETEELKNKGKEIAEKLMGKTLVIYSSAKFKSLAMIWKIKFNENSKVPAFCNFFPELNHNEMVGFTNPQSKFYILMLRDSDDHPQNLKRFDITAKLFQEKNIKTEMIDMENSHIFYKIFSTLCLGDWISYYLALEYNQDPTPVEMVEKFKGLLK